VTVAQTPSLLEVQRRRRGLHPRLQAVDHVRRARVDDQAVSRFW
jgi:hypothetical protein